MERKEILELERDMFRQVQQSVIDPINRRLNVAFDAKLSALTGCLRAGSITTKETRECIERAEAAYKEEWESSGVLLTDLEVT